MGENSPSEDSTRRSRDRLSRLGYRVVPSERHRPLGTALPSNFARAKGAGPGQRAPKPHPGPRGLPDSPRLLRAAGGPSSSCATATGGGPGCG